MKARLPPDFEVHAGMIQPVGLFASIVRAFAWILIVLLHVVRLSGVEELTPAQLSLSNSTAQDRHAHTCCVFLVDEDFPGDFSWASIWGAHLFTAGCIVCCLDAIISFGNAGTFQAGWRSVSNLAGLAWVFMAAGAAFISISAQLEQDADVEVTSFQFPGMLFLLLASFAYLLWLFMHPAQLRRHFQKLAASEGRGSGLDKAMVSWPERTKEPEMVHQTASDPLPVAVAVKVNTLPGEPVCGCTMGGSGANFAFVEFRTAEEAANGLRLNGVELLGCQLKVGRPKGYTGPDTGTPQLALPGLPGQPQSAIDSRLCLCCIPTFVSEERIKELLITFGQLKFYALQKDSEGKSVGVAFFEYQDMMTQQQARVALEGLELGNNKLKVLKPDQVIELGLVDREQKLGARVVPSKVVYLKNIVTLEDLADETGYVEICTDIRLEGEKFGAVVSIEVPRGGGGGGSGGGGGGLNNALPAPAGPLALTNAPTEEPKENP
eukprot:g11217.t1